MRPPRQIFTALAAGGLSGVIICGIWLLQRELRISEAMQLANHPELPSASLDGVRMRLYELRERYGRISALDVERKHSNAVSLGGQLQSRVESAALKLGENLRPEPPRAFKPEAFFVAYSPGVCRMQLVGWTLKGGRAAYAFRISYDNRDLLDETYSDVREGDVVGDLRLLSSASPNQRGRTYEKIDRVTPRGKEIKKVVKLPDFRILQLSLKRHSNPSEKFVLESAYSEADRLKAERSGRSFEDSVQCEVPTATIALREDPDTAMRSFTTKEGSKFLFAGREYLVRRIWPDRIEVCPTDQEGRPQVWAQVQLD